MKMLKTIINFFTKKNESEIKSESKDFNKAQEGATAFEQNADEETAPLAPKPNTGDDDLVEEE